MIFFPAVTTLEELSDLVYRSAWHLDLLESTEFTIYTTCELQLASMKKPEGFTGEVNDKLSNFINKVQLITCDGKYTGNLVTGATAVLKWIENDKAINDFLKKNCSCTIYRVDPEVVRQEGSFYNQSAFDLLPDKER